MSLQEFFHIVKLEKKYEVDIIIDNKLEYLEIDNFKELTEKHPKLLKMEVTQFSSTGASPSEPIPYFDLYLES